MSSSMKVVLKTATAAARAKVAPYRARTILMIPATIGPNATMKNGPPSENVNSVMNTPTKIRTMPFPTA